MRDTLFFYAPLVLAPIAIFIGSAIPYPELPHFVVTMWDKFLHTVEYGVFGIILARAFAHQRRWPKLRARWFIATILLASFYGVTDEFHQGFVPGRYVELLDWVADTLGGSIGATICLIPWIRQFPRTAPQA